MNMTEQEALERENLFLQQRLDARLEKSSDNWFILKMTMVITFGIVLLIGGIVLACYQTGHRTADLRQTCIEQHGTWAGGNCVPGSQ